MQATGQAYAAGGAAATQAAFYFLGGDENTLTVLDAMVVTVQLDLNTAPGTPTNMSFVPQARGRSAGGVDVLRCEAAYAPATAATAPTAGRLALHALVAAP